MKYGMVINYGYCSGCHSCEISCRKELGLPIEEWGIKVTDTGLEKLEGAWEWDYMPIPSSLCTMCASRKDQGIKAACELHCLADVIRIVSTQDIDTTMNEMSDSKAVCFILP